MGVRRRNLIQHELCSLCDSESASRALERLAACPEAMVYTDDEAGDFMYAAVLFDRESTKDLVGGLRRAGISVPPHTVFDSYRMGRHVFRRWGDAAVREAFLVKGFPMDPSGIACLRRKHDMGEVIRAVETYGSAGAFAILRRHGVGDMAEELWAKYADEMRHLHHAQLAVTKILMHTYINAPEPARQPTLWEERKLSRRLALRAVQLHSVDKHLRRLRRDRKAMLRQIREIKQQEQPELGRLAAELQVLRAEMAAEEARHAAAMAEQAAALEQQVAQLKAALDATTREVRETIALRSAIAGTYRGYAR